MYLARRDEAHDQSLTALQVDTDLLSGLHPIEKDGRRQHADISVLLTVVRIVEPYLRIHQIGSQIVIRHRPRDELLDLVPIGREVRGRQLRAGAAAERLHALEYLPLQLGRKPAVGLTEIAAEELHHRLRKSDVRLRIEHLLLRQAARHHEKRHVADDFGCRSDFDDVPKHEVDVGVGLGDLRPTSISDAQRARLLAQVRVLATGHAVNVNLGRARANIALESRVQLARLLPIR